MNSLEIDTLLLTFSPALAIAYCFFPELIPVALLDSIILAGREMTSGK